MRPATPVSAPVSLSATVPAATMAGVVGPPTGFGIAFLIARIIFWRGPRRRGHGVGLRDRTRVPAKAGLGRPIRAGGSRAARPRLSAPAIRAPGGQATRGGRPAQRGGAPAGAVGHAPRARARRPGLRTVEAGAVERDPRALVVGAHRLRLPGTRHRERRDHRPLRHRRAEGALPAAAAQRRVLLVLLHDRAA